MQSSQGMDGTENQANIGTPGEEIAPSSDAIYIGEGLALLAQAVLALSDSINSLARTSQVEQEEVSDLFGYDLSGKRIG